MANRTFKVYGQAYAASGDVSVVMTVGGNEVFNGAVNDSSTVRSGPPETKNHLWTYELDENTTGNLAVTIAVTGGELCVGPTDHNLGPAYYIPLTWFTTEADGNWSAADQTYMASQIGQTALDAQQAGLYDKLVAGTGTSADEADVFAANASAPRDADTYIPVNDVRSALAINGATDDARIVEADTDVEQATWWPILQDGDTLTYTWAFNPDEDAFTG